MAIIAVHLLAIRRNSPWGILREIIILQFCSPYRDTNIPMSCKVSYAISTLTKNYDIKNKVIKSILSINYFFNCSILNALVKQLFLTLNVLDGMSNQIEKNPNPNIY